MNLKNSKNGFNILIIFIIITIQNVSANCKYEFNINSKRK